MKQFILILVLLLSLVGSSGLVRGQGGGEYRAITPSFAWLLASSPPLMKTSPEL